MRKSWTFSLGLGNSMRVTRSFRGEDLGGHRGTFLALEDEHGFRITVEMPPSWPGTSIQPHPPAVGSRYRVDFHALDEEEE